MPAFSSLERAATALASAILDPSTPKVPAVPAAVTGNDIANARERLRGAIGRNTAGPTFFLFPDVPSTLGATSKKLHVSEGGDPAAGSDRTEAQMGALNIDSVVYNLCMGDAAGSSAAGLTLAGDPSQAVTLRPIAASPFVGIRASIGAGAPQDISIDQAVALVGKEWLPWAGADEQPPPIAAQVGIPLVAAALATAIDPAVIYGPTGPSHVMRAAALGVITTAWTQCDHVADFVAGLVNRDIARPLVVALAALGVPPAAGEGSMLTAVRAAAPTFFSALADAIDSLPPLHAEIIAANDRVTNLHMVVGHYQAGRHAGQALERAERAAPPPPPPAPIPPPGVDPVAAAIAAALGAAPPADPLETEARKRLAGSGLSPLLLDQAVVGLVAALRASGWTPPAPSAPPPPPGPTAPPPIGATFSGLRIPGSEHLSPLEVVHAIASAFGKSDAELAAAITVAAGKPPPDAFFLGDAEGLAIQAAADWDAICVGATIDPLPPSSWLEAGRRIRLEADGFRERSARARASGGHGASTEEAADKTNIPKASAKGKATAASALVIAGLTAKSVVDAEMVAVKLADPIGEALRIKQTSYGARALTYLLSDGTVTGSMPTKGTPPRTHPAPPPPPGRTHSLQSSLIARSGTPAPLHGEPSGETQQLTPPLRAFSPSALPPPSPRA